MSFIKRVIRKLLSIPKRIVKKIIKILTFLNKDKLINKLMKYDVISFDIFDTLITRTLYEPDDIFALMETKVDKAILKDSIINMRKKAEQQAREKLNKDVNIDEIYNELGIIYKLTDKQVNDLKELEINMELLLVQPRRIMLDVLKTLVDNKKKVILTSDMYLPKDVIIKMLKKSGYEEGKHYDEFYLSNDLNMRKDDSSLWKHLKSIYSKNRIIHVGDNNISDFELPKKMGIKAIHIKNPREQLKSTYFYGLLMNRINDRSVSDSIMLGYFINEQIFNSPFSINLDSLDSLSKVMIAPVIGDYLEYINNSIDENDHLLFLAREGYYLEKLYIDYCKIFNKKENKHDYFLTSRTATMGATITSDEDIISMLNRDYNGSIKSFLYNIFNIEYDKEDFNIILPNDIDKIKDIVLSYSNDIINKSNEYKSNYLSYIGSLLDIKKESPVLIDLGYSGTIQYHLSKMIDRDLKGIYLTNSSNVKKYSSKSKLLFDFDINDNNRFEQIYYYSLVLEFFLCAPYGQLQHFDKKNGKVEPIYNDEVLDETKSKTAKRIYECVIEYFGRINDIKKQFDLSISKDLLCDFYSFVVDSNVIDKSVKDCFMFMDSFTSVEPKNVFKIINKY